MSLQQDSREIKRNLYISTCEQKTYLIVLAIDSNYAGNETHHFSTDKGEPVGGCVRDVFLDQFQVRCANYIMLGWLPVSFELRMRGSENWRTRVPAPLVTLRRHLTDSQKADLESFHEAYKNYTFDYLQLVSK